MTTFVVAERGGGFLAQIIQYPACLASRILDTEDVGCWNTDALCRLGWQHDIFPIPSEGRYSTDEDGKLERRSHAFGIPTQHQGSSNRGSFGETQDAMIGKLVVLL